MTHEPVLPWNDFFRMPCVSGMILKMIRPHGERPLWGEIESARILESGEVEISLSWTSNTNPYGKRVTKRTATEPFTFKPRHCGPYTSGTSLFRLYDERPGIVHLIFPPVGNAALVREVDRKTA